MKIIAIYCYYDDYPIMSLTKDHMFLDIVVPELNPTSKTYVINIFWRSLFILQIF